MERIQLMFKSVKWLKKEDLPLLKVPTFILRYISNFYIKCNADLPNKYV